MKNKAIFFDRDGVLNHAIIKNDKPYPPASLEELMIFSDAEKSLTQLRANNYLLIGVTNQPDVARGTTKKSLVEQINQKLLQQLPLTEILVCYHDDHNNCDCRKPLPGLLLRASEQYGIDLEKSVMIGDRWRDIEAGQRARCKTIWLKQNYKEKEPDKPDFVASNLSEAVTWILGI